MRRRDKDFLTDMATEQKRVWAKGIVKRMMQAWGVEQMQELTRFIGGHVRMPSNWINKGAIPWEVIYTCHLETGASLDWLYDGKLPPPRQSPELHDKLSEQLLCLFNAAERVGYIRKEKPNGLSELARLAAGEVLEFFDHSPQPQAAKDDS